jgi:hypothetical protein
MYRFFLSPWRADRDLRSRERAVGAALLLGKDLDFRTPRGTIRLLRRPGAEVHARDYLGELNRELAADDGYVR